MNEKNKKILYFECFSGISGDMTVASLLDLGADEGRLRGALDSLGMEDEFEIRIGRTKKCGIDACTFDVILKEQQNDGHVHDEDIPHHSHAQNEDGLHHGYVHSGDVAHHSHAHNEDGAHHGHAYSEDVAYHGHVHNEDGAHHSHAQNEDGLHHGHVHHGRNIQDVYEIIDRLEGQENVKERARSMFRVVAEAESRAHGIPVEEVHFHEVGAVDSIVDIISTAVCLEDIGADEIVFSELYEGSGHVKCRHGVLPVPVPAVLNIVQEHKLLLHRLDVQGEMVTPTGAAIAAASATSQKLPGNCRILRTGTGAGKKDFGHANILRTMLMEAEAEEPVGTLVILEANMDDCTGEALGYTMEQLLRAGARDVWYVPAYMKKNRPAYILNVLTEEGKREEMESLIFKHTTTIGIRRHEVLRTAMQRRYGKVETRFGEAEVKACMFGGRTEYYPEYESIRKLCEASGAGFQEVFSETVKAAEAASGGTESGEKDIEWMERMGQ